MPRTLSIRSYIACLIMGGLIPMLIFSAVLVIHSANDERAMIERDIRNGTTQLAGELDHELSAMLSPLFVLAGSTSLQTDDMPEFYRQAQALAQRQKWNVILADATGLEIINTRSPLGTRLPLAAQREALRQAAETGRPTISDLVVGASSGQPAVAIIVPVKREGRPGYFIIVNIIDAVKDAIVQRLPPSAAFVVVYDRQGRIVVRAPAIEGLVGQRALASTTERLGKGDAGAFLTNARDGLPVYNSFSRLAQTGWVVAVAVPQDVLYAPLRRSVLALVTAGVAALLLAIGIAVLLGQHVARKVRELSGLAMAMGRGDTIVPPSPSGIREIDQVGHALAAAAATVGRRTAERTAALEALEREVADRERVEQQLLRAQKMEAIGQLTGGIAHDFNNILGAVAGYLELAADRVTGDAETTETIEGALTSVMRAGELTRRLLAFARQQPLEPRATELNDLVSGMTPLLRRTLGEATTITVSQAPELWLAMADPARVEDALLNLAINARDAMPEGGTLTIETANVMLDERYAAENLDVLPGAYVMLAVTDTGTGMAPEIIELVFEPFFTTKEAGKGSGLGLSMVYGFVKQSQGHVKIYSELGHGTSVKLYLPRGGVAAAAVAEDAAALPLPGGTESILLVEDNPAMRSVGFRILRDLGYRVHQAENASAALAVIDAGEQVDLLFTDIVMPGGITGRELAEEVRKRRPELPVMFTSGYAGSAISNANGTLKGTVIAKPYRRKDLAERIREALEHVQC